MAEEPPPAESFVVVKLGGSLLTRPDLADRLRMVLRQASARPLLIVGGGETAEIVRRWDQTHYLSASSAHWLAVAAMDLNRQFVLALLPELVPVTTFAEAEEIWRAERIPVIKVWEWLKSEEEKPTEKLPHSWNVTSDSIAAWAAIRWGTAGLLLLKSINPPSCENEWGRAVDGYFHLLAPRIPSLSWCNLSSHRAEIVKCESPARFDGLERKNESNTKNRE